MVTWTRDGEEWERSDGVRIRRESHLLNPFSVVSRHGSKLMMQHPYRASTIHRFKTPEFAMSAADRRWPMKEVVGA